MKNCLVFLLAILALSSCSNTPRYHSFGYNVEWKTRVAQRTKPATTPRSAESQKRSQGETVEIKQAAHHPFTQPQAPIEKPENHRQEIEVNNPPFLKQFFTISEAKTLSRQTEHLEHIAGKKPLAAGFSKGLLQMKSTSHKSGKIGNHGNSLSRDPSEETLKIIGLILGLLGIFFGSDSSSGGGGGGRGGYFDWTAFWAIAAIVIAVGGVVAAIALKGVFKPGIYTGILLIPFTVLGLPAGIIGLIKSIRDYYDVGKYLSIAALSLLGVMWIIALVSL